MNLASVLWTSTILLVITAAGGLVMAGIAFKGNQQPPTWLAMLHGFLGAAALTLLLYAAATIGLPGMALTALVLLLVAAAGGVVLNLKYHWKQLPLPRGLVIVHAAAAVAGFLLLLAATWGARSV